MGWSGYAIGMVILFIVLGISIILGAVSIAMRVLYRRKKIEKITFTRNTTYIKAEPDTTGYNKGEPDSKLKKIIDSFPQFDKSSIHCVRNIGQGNYGVVFHAKAACIVPGEKLTEVAVKTLKKESSLEALESFVNEANLMFGFSSAPLVCSPFHDTIVVKENISCADPMEFHITVLHLSNSLQCAIIVERMKEG